MSVVEYGIFNDEGCIESQLYSEQEAVLRVAEYRAEDEARGDDPEDLTVGVICHEHEEQLADSCEECYAEELCEQCQDPDCDDDCADQNR